MDGVGNVGAQSLCAHSILRRDLLGDFDIAIGDLAAHVIARQLEGRLAMSNAHVGIMIDRLQIGDEAFHKAKRDKILKFERSREFVACKLPPNRGMSVRSSRGVRILGLCMAIASVSGSNAGATAVAWEGEVLRDDGFRGQATASSVDDSTDRCRCAHEYR